MSAASRAWIVASSIGAVEALKDQLGVCRWNHALRSLQQHAKSNIRSYTQAKTLSSATSAAVSNKVKRTKEESMRKVMDLSCWGPNTSRFQCVDYSNCIHHCAARFMKIQYYLCSLFVMACIPLAFTLCIYLIHNTKFCL